MQSTNFVALAGHLNDYPLADLMWILRHKRKSGRLLVEYAMSPCSFYFVEGNLVDAQMNTLNGLQAVLVALSQPNAAFNFNPLIEAPRRSINESSQKVILELLGCWDEKIIDVEASEGHGQMVSSPATVGMGTAVEAVPEMLQGAREVLALPASPLERVGARRGRQLLIASAVISLLVSFATVVLFTRWSIKRDLNAALTEMANTRPIDAGLNGATIAKAQTVKVRLEVEKGRVRQSFIEEHRPGMEAYEALALRIARQRRYPETVNGQDTILLKINERE
ncbi:MAG TPA: DUF4388 domain-containing protein [Pyrinomonadaceae bacterium]|jgi:hypothetical protein|nr:DUF4388 domain-containing protein [Pyrinomonadaceae bacterium]